MSPSGGGSAGGHGSDASHQDHQGYASEAWLDNEQIEQQSIQYQVAAKREENQIEAHYLVVHTHTHTKEKEKKEVLMIFLCAKAMHGLKNVSSKLF